MINGVTTNWGGMQLLGKLLTVTTTAHNHSALRCHSLLRFKKIIVGKALLNVP